MEQIKRLAANKPMIKQYDEAQESLKGVREHHNNLYTQLKAKNAELTALKEVEDKFREAMDAARAKADWRFSHTRSTAGAPWHAPCRRGPTASRGAWTSQKLPACCCPCALCRAATSDRPRATPAAPAPA